MILEYRLSKPEIKPGLGVLPRENSLIEGYTYKVPLLIKESYLLLYCALLREVFKFI